MDEIMKVSPNIDLTENNVFGRKTNVFSADISGEYSNSRLMSMMDSGKIDNDESKELKTVYPGMFNYITNTTRSSYSYRYNGDVVYDMAIRPKSLDSIKQILNDITLSIINNKGADSLKQIYDKIISDFGSIKEFRSIIESSVVYRCGKLYAMVKRGWTYSYSWSNYEYASNNTFSTTYYHTDNSTMTVYRVSCDAIDYDDYVVDITPEIFMDLEYKDIQEMQQNPDTLITGKTSGYIQLINPYIELLNIILTPMERFNENITSNDGLKALYKSGPDFDNLLKLSTFDESYICESFGNRKIIPFGCGYRKVVELSFEEYGNYSELPGITIEDDGVLLSYYDEMYPSYYQDRGLHLLKQLNPIYDTIEFDMQTMESYIRNDKGTGGRNRPTSRLYSGQRVDKFYRKENNFWEVEVI